MNEQERLVALLARRGLSVSAAESLTGGMVASLLVSVPGASAVFPGGAVTYAPDVKEALLGVSGESIRRFGVVSAEVAREMARGCRTLFGTDAAVSTTGLAGPGGATPGTPLGRVYIGVAVGDNVFSFEETFCGDRAEVRTAAANAAIRHLTECLEP